MVADTNQGPFSVSRVVTIGSGGNWGDGARQRDAIVPGWKTVSLRSR